MTFALLLVSLLVLPKEWTREEKRSVSCVAGGIVSALNKVL